MSKENACVPIALYRRLTQSETDVGVSTAFGAFGPTTVIIGVIAHSLSGTCRRAFSSPDLFSSAAT